MHLAEERAEQLDLAGQWIAGAGRADGARLGADRRVGGPSGRRRGRRSSRQSGERRFRGWSSSSPSRGQAAGGSADGCGIVRVQRPIDANPAIAIRRRARRSTRRPREPAGRRPGSGTDGARASDVMTADEADGRRPGAPNPTGRSRLTAARHQARIGHSQHRGRRGRQKSAPTSMSAWVHSPALPSGTSSSASRLQVGLAASPAPAADDAPEHAANVRVDRADARARRRSRRPPARCTARRPASRRRSSGFSGSRPPNSSTIIRAARCRLSARRL